MQLVVAPVTERGLPDRRRLSGKQRVTSNGLPSFQNVIAGAHQLVRQRLGSDDVVGPGLLAFVETLGLGAKAPGEVRPGLAASTWMNFSRMRVL